MADPVWPIISVDESPFNETTDNVTNDARLALLDAVHKLNLVFAARGAALGIAPLNADQQIDAQYYNATGLLGALINVDGSGSLLDADLLDGFDASAFLLVNGSRPIATTRSALPTGWSVQITASAGSNNVRTRVLELTTLLTGASATVAFGTELSLRAVNASGNQRDQLIIASEWANATQGSELGVFTTRLHVTGVMRDVHKRIGNWEEWAVTTTPATLPPASWGQVYMTAGGLAVRDSGGGITVLGSAGAGNHSALSNLNVPGDHTWAMTLDGTRVMTGNVQHGAFCADFTDRTDPGTVAGSHLQLYSKSGGLYYKVGTTVVGPLAATSAAGDHNLLSNLTVGDVHTHYLLRQPTANVIINTSAGDFDFTIRGLANNNNFVLDASTGVVAINRVPGSLTLGRFQVLESGATNTAIWAFSTSGGGVVCGTTTGAALNATSNGTGWAGFFQRAATSSVGTTPAVDINDSDPTFGWMALRVSQSALTGPVAVFRHGATERLSINATELVVNNSLANYGFRISGDTVSDLFNVLAATDKITINAGVSTDLFGRVNVFAGSSTLHGIYAQTSGASSAAICVEAKTGGLYGLYVLGGQQTGIRVEGGGGNSANGGRGIWMRRTGSSPFWGMLEIEDASTAPAIWVKSTGTGYGMLITDAVGNTLFSVPADGGNTCQYWLIQGLLTTPAHSISQPNGEVQVYVKFGKLIFGFNDGGTVRYKYLDMTGTGVTWVHSTTAP